MRGNVVRIYDFVDEGLGHSSYMIDLGNGTAAIIDPPRFPTAHESLADNLGLSIAWTLDTHSHADYVTGSPALAARRGATFVAPRASRLATPHRPIEDREHIQLASDIELIAMATPGHTPDHHAYLLIELGTPVALFTGGSLMVGAIGRTDLCGPDLARPLAHDMFRSLRRFDELSAELPVYPTHGAGSFCSAPGGTRRSTTIGRELVENPLFSIRDEDAFVEQLLAGFGSFPTYFAILPELNRLGPTRYDTLPRLAPLSPDDLERHVAAGGVVVDARPVAKFAAGHVPDSISNSLRPAFASWLGWLVGLDCSLVFVLDADQDRDDLVRQCLNIGHEHLVGELGGGIKAWTSELRRVHTIPLVDPALMTHDVVDVRQANEYQEGHVPGAANVELAALSRTHLCDHPLTVMCGHGERAMTGASLLAAGGRTDLVVLEGGPDTWSCAFDTPLEVGQ